MSSNKCLSERELEILQLLALDLTDREIARRLQLSTRTVQNHLRWIYTKLGVKGRAGAVAQGLAKNIISPPTFPISEKA